MGFWNRIGTAQQHLFNRRALRAESTRRRLLAEAELYDKMAELSALDGTAQGEGTSEWAKEKAQELRMKAAIL